MEVFVAGGFGFFFLVYGRKESPLKIFSILNNVMGSVAFNRATVLVPS